MATIATPNITNTTRKFFQVTANRFRANIQLVGNLFPGDLRIIGNNLQYDLRIVLRYFLKDTLRDTLEVTLNGAQILGHQQNIRSYADFYTKFLLKVLVLFFDGRIGPPHQSRNCTLVKFQQIQMAQG